MAATLLTQMERYAAGALFALALRSAQIHQIQPLGCMDVADGDDEVPDRHSSCSSGSGTGSSEGEDGDASAQLWTHKRRSLLRPVFRFLEIERKAWAGLEETAASSSGKHHIGAFLRMLFEESDETPEMLDQQLALRKGIDAMALSLETTDSSEEEIIEEHCKYKHEPHQKVSSDNASAEGEMPKRSEVIQILNNEKLSRKERNLAQVEGFHEEKSVLTDMSKKGQRNIAVLFVLLSACVADLLDDGEEHSRQRKGYDARHRVALRLLATWFDIKWTKVEAMEIMVACSAIAAAKEGAQTDDSSPSKSKWSKWKRGGIIGAAALTGGTLLAITGGLAAPAIAAGFSALAPTLGTLVPVIGASGFAAAASAAGSVAGSVAVAASFGAAGAGLSGSKMARRIGSVEEFDFIPIGGNHNQGRLSVAILVSGFIFEKADFVKPWKGGPDGLESYAIQWETKNLVAVSNAIQDWLTSRLTMELMKQGAMMTVLSTLVTALAWPTVLLSATDFIDGHWTIAIDRSDKAGQLLADVLISGLQGNRPVTLVGFSLGARLIFKCLQYLAESGDNEGIIERVVLLGAPISLKDEPWESARRMVAGRFVNVYSTNDWILGVTFRASLLSKGLAGIQPVDVAGVENVDVTELIDGHSSYLWTAHQILDQLELDTYYPVFSCSAKPLHPEA